MNSATEELFRAAKYGKAEEVKALIMAGADVSAKNFAGITALDYAKNDEIKRIILNATK